MKIIEKFIKIFKKKGKRKAAFEYEVLLSPRKRIGLVRQTDCLNQE